MKKLLFFALAALALASCSKNNSTPNITVTFDDAQLDSTGCLNKTSYRSGIISLSNNYDTAYSYWEGFAVSNNTDTVDGTSLNQYSVVSGAAHSGRNFAVAYAGFSIPTEIVSDNDISPVSLFVNNSTFVYKTILNGSPYSRAFTDGDYYSVTFTGISADGDTTGSVTTYLADFRNGSKTIINTWQKVSLTPLGTCRRILLSFHSTDQGDWGINTPCYALIDDFEYTK